MSVLYIIIIYNTIEYNTICFLLHYSELLTVYYYKSGYRIVGIGSNSSGN